ncbi:MAG: nitrilase [Spirochaetales bacterium]|nr:nitrilase [Spirochaetales bacterium]
MIVGYVQTSPAFGLQEKNFRQVEELTGGIKADLLVLPELFATGYAFTSREEALSLGEGTGGPTAAFLQSLAERTGGAVAAGFPEKDGIRLYNAAMLVSEVGVLAVYRKIHLFAREKFVFDPGDRPFAVYPLPSCAVGLMICFDWAFPEAARSLALQGAQVIAHPANLVTPYCQEAMRTRCLENRLFAVTANRIGSEKRGEQDLTFTGMSQVTGCKGEVLHRGDNTGTEVRLVELDPAAALDKNLTPLNHLLDDRRPELYLT